MSEACQCIAAALHEDCPDLAKIARETSAALQEAEEHQLKLTELLKN